jgi:hypothetical protein
MLFQFTQSYLISRCEAEPDVDRDVKVSQDKCHQRKCKHEKGILNTVKVYFNLFTEKNMLSD